MNEASVVDLLSAHPVTADLSEDDRRMLAALAVERRFERDELVIREDQPANAFFLIVSGRVAIEVFMPGEEPRTLQTVAAGSALGWSWMVPPYHWEFDARALEPTVAVEIDGPRLRELVHRECCLGLHIVEKLLFVVVDRLKASRLQSLDVHAPRQS